MNKVSFEGKLTEFDKEDSGCALIAELSSDKEPHLFVRLQSWDDKKEHPTFNAFVGKKIRVTVEEILDASTYVFIPFIDEDKEVCFGITPKAHFDKSGGYITDYHIYKEIKNILPSKFVEVQESTFQYRGAWKAGRQELLDAGFVEVKTTRWSTYPSD